MRALCNTPTQVSCRLGPRIRRQPIRSVRVLQISSALRPCKIYFNPRSLPDFISIPQRATTDPLIRAQVILPSQESRAIRGTSRPCDPTRSDPISFDPTLFSPVSFDPTSFDPISFNPISFDPGKSTEHREDCLVDTALSDVLVLDNSNISLNPDLEQYLDVNPRSYHEVTEADYLSSPFWIPDFASAQPGPGPTVPQNQNPYDLPAECSLNSSFDNNVISTADFLVPDGNLICSTPSSSTTNSDVWAGLRVRSQQTTLKTPCEVSATPTARMVIPRAASRHRCTVCRQAFASAARLNSHKKTHLRHACAVEGCSKDFTTPKDLRRHQNTVHAGGPLSSSSELLACKRCPYQTRRKDHLKRHAQSHQNRNHKK